MITKIKTLSIKETFANIKYFDSEDALFISIMSTRRPAIFEKDTDRTITLFFDDVTPTSWLRYDMSKYKFASSKDAEKIVKFISKHSKTKKQETLYVQCTLGISRSGAVATYALEQSNMNRNRFKMINQKIDPNPWVLEKLIEAELGMK